MVSRTAAAISGHLLPWWKQTSLHKRPMQRLHSSACRIWEPLWQSMFGSVTDIQFPGQNFLKKKCLLLKITAWIWPIFFSVMTMLKQLGHWSSMIDERPLCKFIPHQVRHLHTSTEFFYELSEVSHLSTTNIWWLHACLPIRYATPSIDQC